MIRYWVAVLLLSVALPFIAYIVAVGVLGLD